ncbi:MAG: hypothetical protein KDB27_16135, partial [Planctomycetales bacterium]|nr:hypothetical protein [Planctomycetales bacterium]
AGYYDLTNDSGTASLGGFRSSCTNNLIPAGGLLNAPDYTRSCTCSYQNQTSLALVHMPDAETWAYGGIVDDKKRVAINFGAPGDRRDSAGTIWVDYPSVGGKSPKPGIKTTPPTEDLLTFRVHSSLIDGPAGWICSSGVRDLRELEIETGNDKAVELRLYFCQPLGNPGSSFQITVNGKVVEQQFQIASVAGGVDRGIIKTYLVKPVDKRIKVELSGESTLLSGAEVVELDE